MGYSLAITAYRQTCNRSHRAKDNEHRRISKIPANNSADQKKGTCLTQVLFFVTLWSPLPQGVYMDKSDIAGRKTLASTTKQAVLFVQKKTVRRVRIAAS